MLFSKFLNCCCFSIMCQIFVWYDRMNIKLTRLKYRVSTVQSAFKHEIFSPPTTLHGHFENAFPVWRENFHRNFKFDVEVDPCVSTFGANLGYTTVIVDKIFCGKAGLCSTARWTGLTWGRNPCLTGGNLRGFFFFISREIFILMLY